MKANTTGSDNTAAGVTALANNTTGSDNTATGRLALLKNTTGNGNSAFGFGALENATGNQNIAIGNQAGSTLMNGDANIYLGHPGVSSESQTMRLGSNLVRTFIAGVVNTPVGGPSVHINAQGQLGVPLSSARYKRDIAALGTRSEGVLRLQPVSFAYRDEAQGVVHYGLIAEEVQAVYPELVTHTATGEVQTVLYEELIPILVNELQREHLEVASLRKELAELRALVGSRTGQ